MIVYVAIVHSQSALPPYHLRESCNARAGSVRIPTDEEAAKRNGLRMCLDCSDSKIGIDRAALRRSQGHARLA